MSHKWDLGKQCRPRSEAAECCISSGSTLFAYGIFFNPYKPSRLFHPYMDRVKRIWYLSPMRAAKVQASLRICAVSPEPPLLAHTSSESRGTFRQKARSLAPLNGWACAVKICHDGMLEDTNSLDGAHILNGSIFSFSGLMSSLMSTFVVRCQCLHLLNTKF